MLFCQLVLIFHEGHRRAIEVLDFRVRGFDDVIFVRRVRAAAVTETKMSGRQVKRLAGEARVNRRAITLPRYGLKLTVWIVSEGRSLTACLRRSVLPIRVWEADGAAVHRKSARLLREIVPAKSGRHR
jgi:hypothetical protein